MSRRIVVEALVVVVQLRAEELLGRVRAPARRACAVPVVTVRPSGRLGDGRATSRRASASSSTPGRSRTPERAPVAAAYLAGLLRRLR